jgi:nitrous oxidase accessory protein NosD
MAKLILQGNVAQVELTTDDEDDQVVATCIEHQGRYFSDACAWTQRYDTLNDAAEYAADHADTGRPE